MRNHHTNKPHPPPPTPPSTLRRDSKEACLLFCLSFHLCQREESVDERQERRASVRERRSGELHRVDPSWLALHGPRLIIIKTHTTWHVYLMAAPGNSKLLLSLAVTCWSTTVPCGTPSVWEGLCVDTILYVKGSELRSDLVILVNTNKAFGWSISERFVLIFLQYLLSGWTWGIHFQLFFSLLKQHCFPNVYRQLQINNPGALLHRRAKLVVNGK